MESEKEAEAKGKDPKKIKLHKYIGESAKSAFERGFEHQNDKRTLQIRSHMLKHAVDRHEECRSCNTQDQHLKDRSLSL